MITQAVREPPIMTDKVVFSYLQDMARQINFAFQQIDDPTSAESVITRAAASAETAAQTSVARQAETLRALIVKTADTVQAAMDELNTRLTGSYIAKSEWGTLRESISNEITATAEGIVQTFSETIDIDSLKQDAADFKDYKMSTSQYIKTGRLFEEDGVVRYGVAVGENLTTVDQDGQTIINRENLAATFTANKLAFWQGGVQVAYISNNRLYISNVDVLGTLTVGHWEISHTNGFTLRYVGG